MKVVNDHRLMVMQSIMDEDYKTLNDALEGKTFTEQRILVSIHDSLHSYWDWDLKYKNGDEVKIPRDVFALHAKLHDMATTDKYRDAFVNGELDKYSSAGAETSEYVYQESNDSQETEVAQVEQVVEVIAVDQVDEDQPVEDSTIDWYLLDLALSAELGDAKLSSEKREALGAKSFCGPERSFPVPDCAHVTAARRLVGKAKLSEDQKAKVLACVNRKAKNMSCDSQEVPSEDQVQCQCGNLQRDYAAALAQIEQLQQDLENLKNSQTVLDTETDTGQNENSNSSSAELPVRVENPSITGHGAGTQVATAKLGDYEKDIVNRYLDIKNKQGLAAADLYLGRKKAARHLPINFNITNFIQESD